MGTTIANSNAATKAEIRALVEDPIPTIDPKQIRSTVDNYQLCTVPTYPAEDDKVVHPCVIYLPTPVSGYRWWMVATPYPTTDPSDYENPSIYVSTDGLTWSDPTGNNPIVPKPAGAGDYNSDPFIWYDETDLKFYVVYREYISTGFGIENLRLVSSTDGLTWTSPVTIYTTTADLYRLVSPSVNKKSDGTWIMHCVDTLTSPKEITYQTASTLTGTWSDPTACTYTMPPGSITDCWHPEIRLTKADQYLGCIQIKDSGGGPIYMISSSDGITFLFGAQLTGNLADYKSSFVQLSNSRAYLFRGNISSRDIYRVNLNAEKEAYNLAHAAGVLNSVTLASNAIAGFEVADKFGRSDNPSTPGTTDSGTAWTVESGTLGILSNQLYAPGAGNNKCTVPHTSGNIEIYTEVAVKTQEAWIMCRYQDASNFWRFCGATSGSFRIQQIIAGGVGVSYSITYTVNNGDKVIIRIYGDDFGVLINGVPLFGFSDSSFSAARKCGLQLSDTTGRFSDYYVRDI